MPDRPIPTLAAHPEGCTMGAAGVETSASDSTGRDENTQLHICGSARSAEAHDGVRGSNAAPADSSLTPPSVQSEKPPHDDTVCHARMQSTEAPRLQNCGAYTGGRVPTEFLPPETGSEWVLADHEDAEDIDPTVARKIERLWALKDEGTHFNATLAKNRSFHNPRVYGRLVRWAGLCETGSNIPVMARHADTGVMWDPNDVDFFRDGNAAHLGMLLAYCETNSSFDTKAARREARGSQSSRAPVGIGIRACVQAGKTAEMIGRGRLMREAMQKSEHIRRLSTDQSTPAPER